MHVNLHMHSKSSYHHLSYDARLFLVEQFSYLPNSTLVSNIAPTPSCLHFYSNDDIFIFCMQLLKPLPLLAPNSNESISSAYCNGVTIEMECDGIVELDFDCVKHMLNETGSWPK